MSTINRNATQFITRVQRFSSLVWYRFSTLPTTGVLLVVLAVVILLGLLIPQQANPETPANIWIATLPPWLQPWGEPLYFLALSRIFQSVWFFGAVAALLLHSLMALADCWQPSWRRARPQDGDVSIEWSHPLSQRVEHSIRLPASPDVYLDKLKRRLAADGFALDNPSVDDTRTVSAVRRRWCWVGVLTFYTSLVLFSMTLFAGHYFWGSENLTLQPFDSQTSQLFGGALELTEIDETSRSGLAVLTPKTDNQLSQTVSWRLYTPTIFNMALIWPAKIEPIITIEARNPAGDLETIIPVQEELSPATHLNLSVDQSDEPFYFLIDSGSLAFQVSPVPAFDQGDYNVQVRREGETSSAEGFMIRLNESFEVDDYSVTLSLNHNLSVVVRRDWPLLLVIVILIFVITISAMLLFLLPPWQLWLVPEVKGRGGQLYGVVEKFYSAKNGPELLDRLMAEEEPKE